MLWIYFIVIVLLFFIIIRLLSSLSEVLAEGILDEKWDRLKYLMEKKRFDITTTLTMAEDGKNIKYIKIMCILEPENFLHKKIIYLKPSPALRFINKSIPIKSNYAHNYFLNKFKNKTTFLNVLKIKSFSIIKKFSIFVFRLK